MIEDPRHDILFVGYQARGTPGRAIQDFGQQHGYVLFDDVRYTIKARIHTVSGYSAHADQKDLIRFVTGMGRPPREIRVSHGDDLAKVTLQKELRRRLPDSTVIIPTN
jgi:metallo-beta-lactamase family protein